LILQPYKKVKKANEKLAKTQKIDIFSSSPNYCNMKNYLLLASCGSHKEPEIPFGSVPNDTASLMIMKYQGQPPKADTNYREVPRLYGFDEETMESLIAKSNEGEVIEVNFMIAAYLDERPMYLKNTVLIQVVREKEKKKAYYFYDLRKPLNTMQVNKGGGLPLCPPPQDCIPPGVGNAQD
jgi:hypothetical protein